MGHAIDRSIAPGKLSGDTIGFSGMKAAMRQFFAKDALGLHYAVQIFTALDDTFRLLLRSLGISIRCRRCSLIVVAEPRLRTAWLAFLSRTLNTVIGCTMGLCFLLLAGPEGWVLPLALTATVLVCTYAIEVPMTGGSRPSPQRS